jgi:hypothetical protein
MAHLLLLNAVIFLAQPAQAFAFPAAAAVHTTCTGVYGDVAPDPTWLHASNVLLRQELPNPAEHGDQYNLSGVDKHNYAKYSHNLRRD